MSKKPKRAVYYSKEKAKLCRLLHEYIASEEFYHYDSVLQRAIEIGRDKHLSLDKGIKEAKQELSKI